MKRVTQYLLERELTTLKERVARYYALDKIRRDFDQDGETILDKLIGAKKRTMAEYDLLHPQLEKTHSRIEEISSMLEHAKWRDEKN